MAKADDLLFKEKEVKINIPSWYTPLNCFALLKNTTSPYLTKKEVLERKMFNLALLKLRTLQIIDLKIDE
jgi:hypothetical protein